MGYLHEADPREWTVDDLGLRVTASRGLPEFGIDEQVPPDPAPLLTAWLTADGQRFRRDAFAGGATIEGLTFAAAYQRARTNMLARPVEFEPHRRFAAGFQVRAEHPASLLAVPEVLAAKAADVPGALLAVVPTGGDLALIGSDEPELALAHGYAMVESAAAVGTSITPRLLHIATDGAATRVEPWVPGAGSPVRPLYERARQLELERRYGPMLQYDEIGRFTFRGTPAACAPPRWSYASTSNRLLSHCIWRPSRYPTLVPPTDWVGVNVRTSRSAPQVWIPPALLADVPGLEVTQTREFGLPLLVVHRPAGAGADESLLLEQLRAVGGRSKAELGFAGEPAHILDWVPSRAGVHGSRFTRFDEFPQLLLP